MTTNVEAPPQPAPPAAPAPAARPKPLLRRLLLPAALLALAAARADQTRAEASLDLTGEEVDKSLDQARAAVKSAQASNLLARQEYDRYSQLYREEAVPLRKHQQVTQARDSAREQLNTAEA